MLILEFLTDKALLDIARRISHDQMDLGIELCIDHAEIQQIQRSHPLSCKDATLEILTVRLIVLFFF